jgi:CubicO group peptidase (beta-lactamase class C family)
MKKEIRYAFILVLLLLSAFSLNPQSGSAGQATSPSLYADAIREFEKFAADRMALDRTPGLSIAFMKGDFVWAKGFGYADLEDMAPVKPETSFRMASITKTFTAFAVQQLVEAGKINLDAEVQAYVSYFPKKKWPLTVRQVLGHLAGISHYKNSSAEEHLKEPKNTQEAIAIFQDFDLVAEPGAKYNYSTYGYNLLGAVIEGASGQSYGDYVKNHIFEPLGMDNSRMDNPADIIPNRVRGYRILDGTLKNSEYVDISSRFAGGGTRSTVLDLIKYAQGILAGKLVNTQTQRAMFTSMATRGGLLTGYGMGWFVQPLKGHFQVYHSGGQPETRTYLMIFPAEKFAVAAASNLESSIPAVYAKRLAELVLDEDLDSAAYAPDRNKRTIYSACEKAFNYGMSELAWSGKRLAQSDIDLSGAFDYFNAVANEQTLKNNFIETERKITAGIHPSANQALTKVGSYMASVLRDAFGEDKLQGYHKSGPTAFFGDYIRLSRSRPAMNKSYRFANALARLIFGWEKDWEKTYTDDVRRLAITPDANFEEIGSELKRTFSGASFYKDFSEEFSGAARYFLEKGDAEKALSILNLDRDLYPGSALPYAALGAAYVWAGNFEAGRQNYKKAVEIDRTHPQVSPGQILSFVNQMRRAKKMKEALEMCLIFMEYFPKDARLSLEAGNSYALSGQREKAIEYYKKALELDPNLAAAKSNLEKLEKIK